MEEILALAPPTAELVVGEDVTQCCLVNAGVLLVRVSEWRLALWRDVWEAPSSEKVHNARFHEQSSLLKQLNARHEGLGRVKPFHSFLGGPAGPKVFPHVCVLPRHALNTNRGDLRRGAPAAPAPDDRCDFIFHACGVPHVFTDEGKCKSKSVALRAMLRSAGLEALAAFDDAAPGGVVPPPAVLREARADDLAHIASLVAENECLINLERDTRAGTAVLERIGVTLYKHADMGLIDLAVAVAARLAKPLGRALGVCLKLLVLSFEVADSVFAVTMMACHSFFRAVRRAVGTAASFVSDAVVSIWKNPAACLLAALAALAAAYFAHDRGVEIDARATATTVFGPLKAVASRLLAALRRTAGAARGLVTAALAPRPAYVYFKSWRFAMTVAVPHLVTSTVLRVLGVSKAPIIDSIGTASSKCVLLPVFVLSAANRMLVARVFVGLVQILVLPILLLYFWCALGVFLYEVHQRAQTLSELSDMRAGRAKATAETATVDALLERLEVPIRVVEARDCGICLAALAADDAIALPCGHQFHSGCCRDWIALKKDEACCPYCRVSLFS